VDLQAVKTSLDAWMKSLQETLVDTRNDLHKVLGLTLQIKKQTIKADLRVNQERTDAKAEAT
jgi:hypothetical protein